MAKCLLQVTGQEAKAACGKEQLAVGMEEGIEGGIHDMRLLWAHNSQEEDWGFILIHARNAFIEENRKKSFGLSGMSGPATRSLPLTATVTGPPWWCATRRTGQATSCIARRA